MCWLESWLRALRAQAPPALWAISSWPALPPSEPPLQLTTNSNAPKATHSHPPTYSKQPSSVLYFCRFSAATYRPVFSVKLRKWHCFTLTFSWCIDGSEGLELFHCGHMSHVLFRDLKFFPWTLIMQLQTFHSPIYPCGVSHWTQKMSKIVS